MPNIFAYAVIFLWPLVALRLSKKLSLDQAVVALFLIPFLLLPEKTAVDLPGLPPFDKGTIPSLVAFAIFYLRYRKQMILLPASKLSKLFVVCLFVFPIFTVINNPDSLQYGSTSLPPLVFADVISTEFTSFAFFYVPFILAYNFLRTTESHETFVKWLVIAGFIYSIPMLWEIRMSPQLHTQVYGFFPHNFGQQIRQGGFRPVVFLGHGLEVAMFIVMVMIGAVCLWRSKLPPLVQWAKTKLAYLAIVIVLCKTMGALVYTALSLPILLLLNVKLRIKAICIIAVFVFCFPILRGEQLIPVEQIFEFFQGIDEERAGSLKFRFDNEDILLDKANERRIFGWGGWGRGRVYDESGEDISVTDGFWIIIFGQYGWLGYVTIFGLLCYPILMLYRSSRGRNAAVVPLVTAGLGVMLVFNMLDLLPNSSLTHITVLLAGAVQGWASHAKRDGTAQMAET